MSAAHTLARTVGIPLASLLIAPLALTLAAPAAQAESAPPVAGRNVVVPGNASLSQSSGLVIAADGTSFWVNQDAGWQIAHPNDTGVVSLIRSDGTAGPSVTISGAKIADAEDLAAGPGPDSTGRWLYLADTGDAINARPKSAGPRKEFAIYRFVEPSVDGSSNEPITVKAQKLAVSFPDAAAHNVEGMLVDPLDGSVLLVEKTTTGGPSPVWQANGNWDDPIASPAALAGTATIAGATGAAVDPQRRFVVIRNVNRAEVYPVGPDQSLAEALREDGTPVPLPAQPQGESITVSPSVPELLLHSEGAKQPISAVELPVGLLDTLRAEQDASRPSPWSGPLIRLGLVAFIGAIGTFAFLTIRNRRRRDTAHAPKTVVDLRDRSNQPQQ